MNDPRQRGTVLRQAGCVSIAGRGLLIEGPPGSGKTSLALMLLDRGAELVGDDGVELSVRDGRLWASPPPNTAGKIEIRNVGIVDMPAIAAAVSLRIVLSGDAPRYIENANVINIEGIEVPTLEFDASGAAAALRAGFALDVHGLPAGKQQHRPLPLGHK